MADKNCYILYKKCRIMYTKKAYTRKKMCAFDNIYNIYIWQYILQSCPINNKYIIFVHDSKH